MKPLGNRVILKELRKEVSVLDVDDSHNDVIQCVVEEVSDPHFKTATDCSHALSVGDTVMISSFSGTRVMIGGVEYILVDVDDVLLKL